MSDESLKPIWDELIKIYKAFADICDRHGLRYYVTDGCAIGAVRHKGFIPWDDDLDVSMPRPDYEKFMVIAKNELPDNLVAFDRRQCPEMKLLFGKVQEVREEKVHEVEKQIGRILSNGLYIDIFPIDGCPSSWFSILHLKFCFWVLLGVQRYRLNRLSHYSVKGKVMWIVGWLSVTMSARLRKIKSVDDIIDAKERLVCYRQYDICDKVVRMSNAVNRLIIHDKRTWGQGVLMPFYGMMVKMPTDYDAHLRALYGDYMCPPPITKRHPTHIFDHYFPWWHGPVE